LANAILFAIHHSNPYISFVDQDKLVNRATPVMFSQYRLSFLLHRAFNKAIPENERIE
jgi:hypothetical protein